MYTAVHFVLLPGNSHKIRKYKEINKLWKNRSYSMYEYNKWRNYQMHDYVWPDSRIFQGQSVLYEGILIKIIPNN